MKRFLTRLVPVALLSVVLFPLPAQAAGSDGILTCPLGTITSTYDPPLSPVTQQVALDINGTVTGCLPNTQNITGGQFHADSTGNINCLTGGPSMGVFSFTWNTGEVTKASYPEITISPRPVGVTVILLTGEVISGPYAGGTMVLQTTVLDFDVTACLRGDVDALGGAIEVVFTDL
ncbi:MULTISPECIES: hypothetical protein [unclassified Nonomuraea]|uniref:hypothetical protein n=1 Tax=unclassified Nonomuraea TaxID=2593643 RepID=UPI0033E4DAF2